MQENLLIATFSLFQNKLINIFYQFCKIAKKQQKILKIASLTFRNQRTFFSKVSLKHQSSWKKTYWISLRTSLRNKLRNFFLKPYCKTGRTHRKITETLLRKTKQKRKTYRRICVLLDHNCILLAASLSNGVVCILKKIRQSNFFSFSVCAYY